MRYRLASLLGTILLCAGTLLAGCAAETPYEPRVDLAGRNPAQYRIDLHDCTRNAEEDRYGPVVAGALIGAGFGAGLGAIGGSLAGGSIDAAAGYGAAGGTIAGAAIGAAQPPPQVAGAINQCLRNNGYKIIS